MSFSEGLLNSAALETILPQLEAEGLEVFIQPSKSMLPSFLNREVPDAIAFGQGRKVAIEVVSEGHLSETKVANMQLTFAAHPEWELRLVYARPRQIRDDIAASPLNVIEDHLAKISATFQTIGAAGALLIAWAAFEAAARSRYQQSLSRPQTPEQLIQTLAADGYVTPDEADELRVIGRMRNEAAHGRLEIPLAWTRLSKFVETTRALLATQKKEMA